MCSVRNSLRWDQSAEHNLGGSAHLHRVAAGTLRYHQKRDVNHRYSEGSSMRIVACIAARLFYIALCIALYAYCISARIISCYPCTFA